MHDQRRIWKDTTLLKDVACIILININLLSLIKTDDLNIARHKRNNKVVIFNDFASAISFLRNHNNDNHLRRRVVWQGHNSLYCIIISIIYINVSANAS